MARGRSGTTWQLLLGLPEPLRCSLLGGAAAGVLGAVVGLVVGLRVHPPTAWFAVLEIGVPAAVLGFVLGLVAGWLASLARGRRRRA